MIENLYQYQEELRKQGVYLSFTGPFSQNLMEGLAELLKQKMSLEEVKTSTIMNVFSVVVEQVQNIIHYSAEKVRTGNLQEAYPLGTLVIGYEGEQYFVMSGNLIANTDVARLREKLTPLCRMTKDELKKIYKEKRRETPEQGSKGAGLGFIDMARKASQPIEFDFQKINAHVSFFSIKVFV